MTEKSLDTYSSLTYNKPMSTKRRNQRLIFRLSEIRKLRGYNLDSLAEKTGLSRSGLGDLESGRNAMMSDDTLVILCDTLKVKPGELLDIAPAP